MLEAVWIGFDVSGFAVLGTVIGFADRHVEYPRFAGGICLPTKNEMTHAIISVEALYPVVLSDVIV